MKKNPLVTIILILAVSALAAWYLYPSIAFYSKAPDARQKILRDNPDFIKKVLNLGLDLQGGMRLVLEIDRSQLDKESGKDVLDRAYTVIENRINGLGVAEPTIQKQGKDRLIIELPGLRDETLAKRVIGSTAQLEFNLLREPAELQRAIQVIDDAVQGKKIADTSAAAAGKSAASDTAKKASAEEQAKAHRLFEGAAGTKDSTDTSHTAEAEPQTTSFSELLVSMGSQIAVLEKNKAKVQDILLRKDVREALERAGLGGSTFLWGHEIEKEGASSVRALYYVKSRAELRGDIIMDARSGIAQGGLDAGQWEVNLELNRDGARKFSRVTGANVSKFLAIVLDSTVYSAPQIRQKISQGRAQITGRFTAEEARGLSVVLRAGALPAPVNIIEERTVGPSLGQDSIKAGVQAGLLGLLAILIFMIIYYKTSGIYASLALVLNGLFVVAAMASVNLTLTLPGIVGLVLNLGMAVDANVLICERIREELLSGKTVRSAIDAGYTRAFSVIIDSHITGLLMAFILLWVGTGPIKGFAVTLSFGLVLSLFTSLVVTRVFYNVFASRNQTRLSI